MKQSIDQNPIKNNQSQAEKETQILDKRVNQEIENLHNLLKNCRGGPDLYTLFFRGCNSFGINVKIPETLLYISSHNSPIFLHNHPNGPIVADSSEKALERFFDKVESYPLNLKRASPRYIHIAMNENIYLCYSSEEAKKHFEECPHYTHRIQRYIPPHTNYVSKVRIH